ncbi:MAG: 4'-phosphopantetheinyl transferase superfamily protein [Pseudomonadota bacterium]
MSPTVNTVAVYAVSIADGDFDREKARAFAWMAPDEREKYERFRFERHRLEFAISRFMLRSVLGDALQQSPASLCFSRHKNGKPFLQADSAPSFNLTHTDDFAALVIDAPGLLLGIDAEPADRMFDPILLSEAFNDEEVALIDDKTNGDASPVSLWTAKEAFLKQIGAGLTISPKRVHIRTNETGVAGAVLDGHYQSHCRFHFATVARRRICVATEQSEPPELRLYRDGAWRREPIEWAVRP